MQTPIYYSNIRDSKRGGRKERVEERYNGAQVAASLYDVVKNRRSTELKLTLSTLTRDKNQSEHTFSSVEKIKFSQLYDLLVSNWHLDSNQDLLRLAVIKINKRRKS